MFTQLTRADVPIVIWLTAIGIFTTILWAACTVTHNYFFHPLRNYPGPLLARLTSLPFIYNSIRGHGVSWIVTLHAIYGDVVRVSPNELSFSGASAIKEIYGHRSSGLIPLEKDPNFYLQPGEDVQHVANAAGAVHQRQRRIFANAFSDKALRLQEPMFTQHCDKLVDTLRAALSISSPHVCDLVQIYNFTTFDIMGDLTFGESLGMLDRNSYHPWVSAIFAGFHFGTYLHAIRRIPLAEKILLLLIPKSIKDKQRLHQEFSTQRVDRRLQTDVQRPDIWGLVLNKTGNNGLTSQEMCANANMFMIGGTETTATLLSGLTFYLLKNKRMMETLTTEIRSTFARNEDITMEGLAKLPYLNACIQEGLRMYPPISNGLPRIVPPGGVTVQGWEVPCGAIIYATHLAVYRNPDNFRDPYAFNPERWLPNATEFVGDRREALQPFSAGPRVCLGKNMAYHEMRLILAKVLFNYDLELQPDSKRWDDQRTYLMWEKGPLKVSLSPYNRELQA